MNKKFWFFAVLITLGFVHVFAWYAVPTQFYLRHSGDFSTPLAALLNTSLLLGAGSLGLTIFVSYFVFLPVRKLATPVFVALALTFWATYIWFGGLDPAVSEEFARVDLEPLRAVIELVLFAAFVSVLIVFGKSSQMAALILLSVGMVFYSAATQLRVNAFEQPPATANGTEKIYSLGQGVNLLVIQFTGFHSAYFADALQADPKLAGILDGFHYFPDTLGVASRPGPQVDAAIHTGQAHNPFIPMANIEANYLGGGSVFSKLGITGAKVRIFRRAGECPNETVCINNPDILRDTRQVQYADTLFAVDSALLVMAPEALKNFVYRGGRWLLSSFTPGGGTTRGQNPAFEDHAFLQMFTNRLRPAQPGNTVTWLRLLNTAAPAILSASCQVMPPPHEYGHEAATSQAHCALQDLSGLLAALKEHKIYDSSAIVVFANSATANEPGAQMSVKRLLDSANPLLLIKPAGSTGALITRQQPAHLTDLPATLCGLTRICQWSTGNDLLGVAGVAVGPRRFLDYTAPKQPVNHADQSGPDYFEVNGPVQNEASWKRVLDRSNIEFQDALQFSALDDPAIFGEGWGLVEIDADAASKRWVVTRRASLNLQLAAESDYLLDFTVYPPPTLDGQVMELRVNGHWVGGYSVGSGLNTLTYKVSSSYILSGANQLDLTFTQLAKPAGVDERELAMSFFTLEIGRVIPAYELEDL